MTATALTESTGLAVARAEMLDALQPLLSDQPWQDTFAAVRRDVLGTRFYRLGEFRPVAAAHRDFPAMIYGPDEALILQPGPSPRLYAPAPAFCAGLLTGLDLSQHHRVCVIGARDPYLTALLCQRLGDDHVTAVEVDTYYLGRVRAGLATAGYHPMLRRSAANADGPAPTHLLCAHPITSIPAAWIRLLGPGGVIVAALSAQRTGGPAVRVIVGCDGTASGQFLPGAPPALPPGPHRDAPTTSIGLTVTGATTELGLARQRLWWPTPTDDIGPY